MGGRWLGSVFSNALSLGRKRSGTKILRGLSPLATPSQNQVPAFPYGLKIHYPATCLRTSGSFLICGGMDVKVAGRHEEVQKGKLKCGGMDVKAAGSHTEVQKGRARGPDWTSTRPQPCQRRGGAVVR